MVTCRFLSCITARRSSHLRMPGLLLPAFSDGFMACRFNRSIPAHSIPVPPSLRGLSSHHPISCRRVLPAPKGLRLPCSYLLGLPPSGSSFSGSLPRHSPSSFVVKTIYTYTNFASIKISYMYILNQKIPPTPNGIDGHARQGTKKPLTRRGWIKKKCL